MLEEKNIIQITITLKTHPKRLISSIQISIPEENMDTIKGLLLKTHHNKDKKLLKDIPKLKIHYNYHTSYSTFQLFYACLYM